MGAGTGEQLEHHLHFTGEAQERATCSNSHKHVVSGLATHRGLSHSRPSLKGYEQGPSGVKQPVRRRGLLGKLKTKLLPQGHHDVNKKFPGPVGLGIEAGTAQTHSTGRMVTLSTLQ